MREEKVYTEATEDFKPFPEPKEVFATDVRLDRERNVVFFRQEGQEGRPSAEDFRRLMRKYESVRRHLERGGTVVNDQRQLEAFDVEAAEVAAELVRMTNHLEDTRLIRIVPESLLSQANVTRSLVTGRSRYENIRARNEAEELLSSGGSSSSRPPEESSDA